MPQLPPAPPVPPVGTPSPAERPPAVDGATAELGFTSQSGNTNRMDTAFKLRATRVTPISTLALSGSVAYGEARHVKSAQELSGGLNYDYYPWRRLSLFGFLIAFNNPFQDLRSRWSLAAGARYDVIKHERGFLALSRPAARARGVQQRPHRPPALPLFLARQGRMEDHANDQADEPHLPRPELRPPLAGLSPGFQHGTPAADRQGRGPQAGLRLPLHEPATTGGAEDRPEVRYCVGGNVKVGV